MVGWLKVRSRLYRCELGYEDCWLVGDKEPSIQKENWDMRMIDWLEVRSHLYSEKVGL